MGPFDEVGSEEMEMWGMFWRERWVGLTGRRLGRWMVDGRSMEMEVSPTGRG